MFSEHFDQLRLSQSRSRHVSPCDSPKSYQARPLRLNRLLEKAPFVPPFQSCNPICAGEAGRDIAASALSSSLFAGAGLDSISIIREGHGVVKRKTTEKARFFALFLHGPR
jgi:hypothetical protein